MLRSAQEIFGYVLHAEDGEIGRCRDFLFDDQDWVVRYMVADTAKWLIGRRVLISPISLGEPDWRTRLFPIRLTKNQIENAPPLHEDEPVSKQYEMEYYKHYGWPYYWIGVHTWGMAAVPGMLMDAPNEPEETKTGDSHLRDIKEVIGYNIQTIGDEIGRVEDFILDDESWTIRYMVINTGKWLPKRKVLISPTWVNSIDWAERQVKVFLSSEQVRNSPEYDPSAPVNRDYEIQIYDYYGRPKYWK